MERMVLRGMKRSWKRKFSAMLALTMAVGGFSNMAAPHKAAADPSVPLPAWKNDAEFWLKADEGVTTATYAAGSGVEKWDNQAGTVRFDVYGGPGYKAAGANFNPVVTFSNTGNTLNDLRQYLRGNEQIDFTDAYAVFKADSGNGGALVGSTTRNGGHGAALFAVDTRGLYLGNINGSYKNINFPDTESSRYQLVEYDTSGTTDTATVTGEQRSFPAPDYSTFSFTPMIGGTKEGSSGRNYYNYNGELAEVIVFSGTTAPYRNQIQSYLALKYGLTLNKGETDYVNSQGTSIWSAAANTGYKNRITGIGRDSGSSLNQGQSKSQDAGALVTIAAGNDMKASNQEIAGGSIADGDFLIFGDNGDSKSPAYQTLADSTNLKRMDREFKVSKTGSWIGKSVTLKLDTLAAPGATHLLVSSNGIFDGSSAQYPLSPEGQVTINGSDLGVTSYFTFAKEEELKGPGGVTNGLQLWLHPGEGIAVGNNQPVNKWEDQSLSGNDATVSSTGKKPMYKDNSANNVNFNPVVEFDGETYLDLQLAKLPTGTGPRTIIGIGQPNDIAGNRYIVSWGSPANGAGMGIASLSGKGAFVGWNNNDLYTDNNFWKVGIPDEIFVTYDASRMATLYSKMKTIEGPVSKNWNTGSTAAKLGSSLAGGEFWNGTIGDVIVYDRALTDQERLKVSSYLAIKYGYSLDSNYVNSANDVVWAKDTAYADNIAGIAYDKKGLLTQKQSQSRSKNDGKQISVGLGAIKQTNSANTTAFTSVNSQYLIWGDNGKELTTFGSPVSIADNTSWKPAERIWKVQNTNNVGAVQLSIPKSAFAAGTQASDIKLLVGSDSVFATATTITVQESGNVFVVDNAMLPTGYFTFAVKEQAPAKAPGGVNGASLWLKADKDAAADAAKQLTGWNDQTGTNQFTVNGAPVYKADVANFNPAVTFENTTKPNQNPNQYLIGDKPITYQDGYAVFKQKDGTIIGSAAPRAGGYGVGIFSKWGKLYVGNGAPGTYRGFSFNDASRYYLAAFDAAAAIQSQGRLNGTPQTVAGNNSFNKIDFTPVIGGTFGGGNSNNWSHFKGDLAEVVLYPSSNTELEKQQIESYLALKYGLTLNSGKTDYIAGNGSDKMWTASNNVGYGKRITGVGRDDGSDLLQKQSKSQDAGALVTIALGSAVQMTNSGNANTINTDSSFLVFSDNDATAKYETSVEEALGHTLKQLTRVFKVEKTNWQDRNITLKLDKTAENPAVLYYLIIDGANSGITLDAAGQATFDSGKLATGSTFTFAKVYKNDLQSSISGAKSLTAASYTPDSWGTLQSALANAEAVLNDPSSTQEQVDAALAALEAARAGLSTGADKVKDKADEIQNEITLGSLKPGDYTTGSWQALTGALDEAKALLDRSPQATAVELGKALSKLEAARGTLVDLSQLRAKEAEIAAEQLQATNYTADSWQAMQRALTAAHAVLADPNATQTEVDAAKDALSAARAALVPAADKTALQTKVTEAESLTEESYTPDSWAALQKALANADTVLNDPNATQEEIDTAKDALEAAKAGLNSTAVQLQTKVAAIQGEIQIGDLKPDDYTANSWKALTDALDEAQALLNRTPSASEDELGQTLSKVQIARGTLVDLSQLRAKETEASSVTGAVYTPESWQALQIALKDARAILSKPEATQAEVDAAKAALEAARAALELAVIDKSALQAKQNEIAAKNLASGNFTQTSWQALQAAITAANAVLNNPIATQTEVNAALYTLKAAYAGLILVNTGGSGDGGNGGGSGSTPAPNKDELTVDVIIGGDKKAGFSKLKIERTKHNDGRITDQVIFDAKTAKEVADKAVNAKEHVARIVILDEKDEVSEMNVSVPLDSLKILEDNHIDLEIYSENASIHVPNASLKGLKDPLYFRFVPVKDQVLRSKVEEEARTDKAVRRLAGNHPVETVGRPMTIETNLPERPVTLTLPISEDALPKDAKERQAYLNDLAVFIKTTDGEKAIVIGELVTQASGELWLRFSSNKFGTFTILHVEGLADKKSGVYHKKYIDGYPDGSFGPDRSVTRAEMAAMLVKSELAEAEAAGQAGYTDVPAQHWAASYVKEASSAGLMSGYQDGTFKLEGTITRAEMATIIYNYLKLDSKEDAKTYTDTAGHWAEGIIAAVYETGIMTGYPTGEFRPDQSLTRSEAVIIVNMLLGRGPLFDTPGSSWQDVDTSHWAYGHIEEASQNHSFKTGEEGEEIWLAH
ncbi:hypothetical protein DQG23_04765 [Paenibacillus contaminans]|uniref:SLH domain-containing protein n=2 Tax=Paenibacillus contaminans TaxID=450362 RepID=A0A329MSD5_9BACL|nr:hypothetical protein DQG23_04765 [Paenibacillus contaminans]